MVLLISQHQSALLFPLRDLTRRPLQTDTSAAEVSECDLGEGADCASRPGRCAGIAEPEQDADPSGRGWA
ncbi:hypothetical protein ACGFNU_50560 [Spirillospora sp. NPDC048911]|uniref:hypothetical protein n=1 Tax=Spirillospora sp. NPDC048911 TaxID=3364527 RepID=UPI0037243D13